MCREGWRSAVGRRPHIGLHLPSSTVTSSTRPAAPRYSKLEITIDRFGQEEDVTGASFAEPISYESERDAGRSSSPSSSSSSSSSRQIHVSRRLSKQSDTARLGNIISKFTQQSTVADRRSLNIGKPRVVFHTPPTRPYQQSRHTPHLQYAVVVRIGLEK